MAVSFQRLLWLLAPLFGFGFAHAGPGQDALVPQQVAEGVYAFIGDGTEPSASNQGFAANSGFVVGSDGVIVIDTGTSYRHGRRMLDAIASVTAKPVLLVVNTHATQEFIFGNAAFAEQGIPILAHKETTDLMRARCGRCLERLQPVLGTAIDGTRLVLPQREYVPGATLDAGGRRLELLHFGWAATPGDLAVLDRDSGTLFAGGLVSADRIPETRDCDFEGWLRALERIQQLPLRHVVPGFGPASGPGAVSATLAYLQDLDASVQRLYERSTSLLESVENASLPAYGAWRQYPALHRQNAQHRYLQLETRDLGGDPRSVALPQQ
jgi:glyoxylase-like metal-dependent hydrolase (beta-lactamase superfamily II)